MKKTAFRQIIKYRNGYKYQLSEDAKTDTPLRPDSIITSPYIILAPDGELLCYAGYAWDGATCCPDVNSIIRASLFHDALYQLIRIGRISPAEKAVADKLMMRHCIEDGMPRLMAKAVHLALKRYGMSATMPSSERLVLVAP